MRKWIENSLQKALWIPFRIWTQVLLIATKKQDGARYQEQQTKRKG